MSPDNAIQRVIPNLILWIFSQYDNYKGWVSTFFLKTVIPRGITVVRCLGWWSFLKNLLFTVICHGV